MRKPTIVLAVIAMAALSACRSGKPSGAAALQTGAAPAGAVAHSTPPNCGGESAVWAIQGAKVYLLPGDRLYGKTKRGEYLCLSQAEAQGFRSARRPFRHHHRKNGLFSV